MAACLSPECPNAVFMPAWSCLFRNQYDASQWSETCLCIRVRFCLGPARVSLRFSFHLADGLVLVRWLFFGLFGFVCFGCWCCFCLRFAWSLTGSCPSVAIVFESIALLPCSFVGSLSLPRISSSLTNFLLTIQCGFRLTRFSFTCSKGILLGCGVFCCGLFGLLVWALLVFGFFLCCFVSLCSFARLSSFTDWCTAHRQQFREQKKVLVLEPALFCCVRPLSPRSLLS